MSGNATPEAVALRRSGDGVVNSNVTEKSIAEVGSRRWPRAATLSASTASRVNSAAAAAGRCYCAPVPPVEQTPACGTHGTICNNLLTLISKRLLPSLQDRCNGRVNRIHLVSFSHSPTLFYFRQFSR